MALQEFLASYAVQVDESGAKRLKDLLEENRTGAKDAAAAFASAAEAVSDLYAGLTGADGSSGGYLAAVFADLQAHAASIAESFASVRNALTTPLAMPEEGSFLDVLSHFTGEDGSGMEIPVTLNTSEAEKAAQSFVAKVQALRPALSVNTTGVTSAVASAVSQIRSMLSALQIIVPVTAMVRLQFPPGFSGVNPNSFPNMPGGGPGGRSPSGENGTPPGYAEGARISSPTLARVGENADPEYIIPVRNERRAVPLIRALLGELSESARSAVWNAIWPDSFTDRYGSLLNSFDSFPSLPGLALEQLASTKQPDSSEGHPGPVAKLPDMINILSPLTLEQFSSAPVMPDPAEILSGFSPEQPRISVNLSEIIPSRFFLPPLDSLMSVSVSPEKETSVSRLISLMTENGWVPSSSDNGAAFSFSFSLPAGPARKDTEEGSDPLFRDAVFPDHQKNQIPSIQIIKEPPEQEKASQLLSWKSSDRFLSGQQVSFPSSVLSAPLPDLSSLSSDLSALTAAARMNFFPQGSGGGNQYHSVDAPVTIQVSAPAASPEAVGRSVYDLTQRHILKTLEGVFR